MARNDSRAVLCSVRVTFATAGLLVGVFGVSSYLAANAGYSEPLPYLTDLEGVLGVVVDSLLPLFHTNPSHLGVNVVTLLVFGSVIERREDGRLYAAFLLGVAVFANLMIPLLGDLVVAGLPFVLGVGASGVTNALVSREWAYRIQQIGHGEFLRSAVLVFASSFVLFVHIFLILSLAHAWATHLTGTLCGLGIGVMEARGGWQLQRTHH